MHAQLEMLAGKPNEGWASSIKMMSSLSQETMHLTCQLQFNTFYTGRRRELTSFPAFFVSFQSGICIYLIKNGKRLRYKRLKCCLWCGSLLNFYKFVLSHGHGFLPCIHTYSEPVLMHFRRNKTIMMYLCI